MANIEMLKEKIKERGMTTTAVCEKSGITRETFYKRLQKPNFRITEALALKKTLRLSNDEMQDIFLS